ncbi:MAG: hypothetical protein IT530_12550 [Burkholderiales bacterium]|nr:hypothetical protein [Burkholderiales bacterium]
MARTDPGISRHTGRCSLAPAWRNVRNTALIMVYFRAFDEFSIRLASRGVACASDASAAATRHESAIPRD